MFVSITNDRSLHPSTLGDLGLTSTSNAVINLSEFTYKKGTEVFGENEPAEYVYQVKTGAIRSYKLLADGRRQIGAFHLVGDVFGFENAGVHRFTAEAVVETTARLFKRQSFEGMATTDALLLCDLIRLTTRNLKHAENHLLLLGRKTAVEKVAAFLVEMGERNGTDNIALPMSRRDIADYLGLRLETVARALTQLKKAGALSFTHRNHREIILLNREALARLDQEDFVT